MSRPSKTVVISREQAGTRLDRLLVQHWPELSRALLQKLVESGQVTVNGSPRKSSYRLRAADVVAAQMPEPAALQPGELSPVPLPLAIVYEDEQLIVINKPAGLTVHPVRAGARPTVVAALLHHCRGRLSDLGDPLRRGVVHRLDRDTSGLLIAAKTNEAHERLAEQFRRRAIGKTYLAVVRGEMAQEAGEIGLPIGRHPRIYDRKVIQRDGGRTALTRYRVLERFRGFTFVELHPVTGRTHQLRVHLSAIGHPVVADRVYGGSKVCCRSELEGRRRVAAEEPLIVRQALHALGIRFRHPATGEEVTLSAPPPGDIEALLCALRELRRVQ